MPDRRPLGFGRHEPTTAAGPTGTPAAATMDDQAAAALLPERPARGHKGTFGKVLAIAGSLDYAGAALLVCRAAGRSGAGLVTLAVPESLQPLFAAKVIEATTMALPEDDVEEIDPEPAIARILDHEHDALVVGPGVRPGLATTDLVRLLLAVPEGDPSPAPIVLDAEALRSMATLREWWSGTVRPSVLTPHPGEFERTFSMEEFTGRTSTGRHPTSYALRELGAAKTEQVKFIDRINRDMAADAGAALLFGRLPSALKKRWFSSSVL